MKTEYIRVYPSCCTSAYCGKYGKDCNNLCSNYKTLQEFKQWVKDNNAIVEDPIWCPTIYTKQNKKQQ